MYPAPDRRAVRQLILSRSYLRISTLPPTSPFLLSLTSSCSPPTGFYDVCSLFWRYVPALSFPLSLFRRSIYGRQTSGQSASWVISVTIADIVACSTALNDFDRPSRFIYPICHLSPYNRLKALNEYPFKCRIAAWIESCVIRIFF